MPFLTNFKSYWPLALSVITVIISLAAQWAILGYRIANVEARQDRQGASITTLQQQVGDLTSAISGMKSDIGSIKDNVTYIRDRIDRATQ